MSGLLIDDIISTNAKISGLIGNANPDDYCSYNKHSPKLIASTMRGIF